ncbi:hypothetical protein [Tautonia sociabilis]|uniref:Uncharacterized protein n=1 Tax=Tautonia sociabilis TaxID=2080755 RepID=A0A432MP65_9BACT|nr:hypothetical protein [Tautonia sociabilis]RUL89243.1 hypothetical protein TsocGM_02150 [Tautonia sociabilis]
MSNRRIVLPLLAAALAPLIVLAQDPGKAPLPPPVEPATEAELVLDEAMRKVKATEQVRATIRQEVEMLGQRFSVEGEYAQQGPYTFSLDLQVQGLPQARGRMRQVCDGQSLWDVSQILDQTYYFRLDLPQVLDKIEAEPFEKFHRDFVIQQRLGLSGPYWMLDGLRQSVRFDRKLEGELNGRPVWILRGNWKDMNALGLGPLATPPAYIPSVVEVQVDKETGWPYKVILLGKRRPTVRNTNAPRVDPATGRPVGEIVSQEEEASRFEISYTDVTFEPEFTLGTFSFRVPDADRDRVRDRTLDLLSELDQMARIIEAQKLQGGDGTPGTMNDLLEGIGLDVPPVGEAPAPAPEPETLPGSGN